MKLQTLELIPRKNGWTSGLLKFGARTTLLLGPNGAGKTPIVKSLCYALGYPVEVPPLIRENCRAVRVEILADGVLYGIEREFASGLSVRVTSTKDDARSFASEQEFSAWLLPLLGISLRTLTRQDGAKVPAYMSVIGPLFFVDQDTGWTQLYAPFETHRFARDQREEALRWILDLPAKHRPVDKSELNKAKVDQASIQEQIAFKRRGLEALKDSFGGDGSQGAAALLQERRAVLEAELSRAQSVFQKMVRADSSVDVLLRSAGQERDDIARKLANAKKRRQQLRDFRNAINSQIEALQQNEVAADVFRTLCGNSACQFFRNDESFGRRLLYLKDQLKDFESSSGENDRELSLLADDLFAAERRVHELAQTKKLELEPEGATSTIAVIEGCSRELAGIYLRLNRMERFEHERNQLDALIEKEARAAEAVADLRPSAGPRKDSSRLLDARENLSATLKEWLLALRTPNLPNDISFDESLRLTVGGERFSADSSHSGSTRTRIVLALHGAIIETSIRMNGNHPSFLVLDAPRQHELSGDDLRSYIEHFQNVVAWHDEKFQLIFSLTDAQLFSNNAVDMIWEPTYLFGGDKRFLGPQS